MGRPDRHDVGRAERFTAFVASHADTVNRYLLNRHRAGDSLDAEDLLAEVFAIAWRRFDEIPADAGVAWLIVVARNRLMNMHSKQRRRAALRKHERPLTAPAAEDEAIAEVAIREAIESLPAAEHEAFTLSAWEGLSPVELGRALGVTQNAASIRLSRAKSMLLSRLGSEYVENHRTLAKDIE